MSRNGYLANFTALAMDDLDRFGGLNPDGPDDGRRAHGNRRGACRYGPQKQRRLLAGRTCPPRFAERKGTPWFGARLPDDRLVQIVAHLQERCGVRATGRLVGVAKDTVVRDAARAGEQARQLPDAWVGFSPLDPHGRVRCDVVRRRHAGGPRRPRPRGG